MLEAVPHTISAPCCLGLRPGRLENARCKLPLAISPKLFRLPTEFSASACEAAESGCVSLDFLYLYSVTL